MIYAIKHVKFDEDKLIDKQMDVYVDLYMNIYLEYDEIENTWYSRYFDNIKVKSNQKEFLNL